ncbi:ankyrin repeat protein [Megavirus baoshan]|uniref:Ankyrin repeat protein n=1 Tax=Megavirus baoshan TaxID=2496520 RepID=A0A8K1W7I7_9VIRU|nr:ankyrin repeat protein [Megavirus baoshan]UFX99895.1 ankyrin repeat protein [Megavirus baoshan]
MMSMQIQDDKYYFNHCPLQSHENVNIYYNGLHLIGYDFKTSDLNLYTSKINDLSINEKICFLIKNMIDGNYDMFNIILNHGPDITSNNECIKVLAHTYPINNQIDYFQQLLNIGLDIHIDNDYPLVLATNRGNLPLIKFLVDNGADITTHDNICIKISVDFIHPDVFDYLLQSGSDIHCDNNYPLRRAVYLEKIHIVRKLLESGANIYCLEMNDLVRIVKFKNYHLIKILIDYGADFSIINFYDNPDKKYGDVEIYNMLLQQGATHEKILSLLMK